MDFRFWGTQCETLRNIYEITGKHVRVRQAQLKAPINIK